MINQEYNCRIRIIYLVKLVSSVIFSVSQVGLWQKFPSRQEIIKITIATAVLKWKYVTSRESVARHRILTMSLKLIERKEKLIFIKIQQSLGPVQRRWEFKAINQFRSLSILLQGTLLGELKTANLTITGDEKYDGSSAENLCVSYLVLKDGTWRGSR